MTPKQIQMASTCGITFPTIRPLFTSPPKPTALQAWIENQNFSSYPEATTIAKKMAANIRCISFNEFLLGLQQTIIDFNARCQEPYVLWIAQDSPRKLAAGCSEQWVAGLALEQCGLRWPEAIVVSDDLDGYLERNPSIKNILFIDDAAYSGTHLKRELTPKLNHFKTNKTKGINIFFAIPFMTRRCHVDIIGGVEKAFQEVNCISLKHDRLAVIGDILTESEKECAKTMDSVDINLTLTYFDHKYPDFMSTSMILESGKPLLNLTLAVECKYHITPYPSTLAENPDYRLVDKQEWNTTYNAYKSSFNPLIPSIICPYKLHTSEEQQNLSTALEKGTLGMRTEYTLPNRYRKYPLLEQFMDAKDNKLNKTSQISFFSGNNSQSEIAGNLISYLEHEISNNNWTVGLGGVKLDSTIDASKRVPKHVKQIYDLCRSQHAAEQKIIDIKAVLEDTHKPANILVFILNKLNFWGILSELRILRTQKTQAFYDKTLNQLTM